MYTCVHELEDAMLVDEIDNGTHDMERRAVLG